MISPQEQQRVDQTEQRFDEMRRVMKAFHKYLSENNAEVEQHNKKILNVVKSTTGSLLMSKDDTLLLSVNLNELVQIFEFGSKVIIQQIQEFSGFMNTTIDDYFDKQNQQCRRIVELNVNNLKQMQLARQNQQKAKKQYEKLCKEVDQSIDSQKKSQNDANSGYNVELASKSENRIKETIKQIALAEQVYRDQTEAVQARQKEFQDGLIESQKQLNMIFKITNEKLLEISMKQDQHNLLSYNWIKGQLDEKIDKIKQFSRLESTQEENLIQNKINSKEQDLILKQTNMRYPEILSRIMGETKGPVQDLEYLMYPELLQRYVEVQSGLVADRIKNIKTFNQLISDLQIQLDNHQKSVSRQAKQSTAYIQDKIQQESGGSGYAKKLIQIQETYIQFLDNQSKKVYQYSQSLQVKQSTIETIIKDQKAQEKSFGNMYSKMIKDILSLKSQFQGLMLDGSEYKNAIVLRDQIQTQLRKMINDNAPILKYSMDQIRETENTRTSQVINIIETVIQSYSLFLDESIRATKVQEENLNKRYDSIEQDIIQLPQLVLPTDSPEVSFVQIFRMTEQLQKSIEQTPQIEDGIEEHDDEEQQMGDGEVKVTQKLREKFQLQDGIKCLASYACAFDDKILLQGRLYIFSTRICFHSYFNSKTLIGNTVLIIPPQEVLTIRKTKVYMLDNALCITTNKGALKFSSFINRESVVNNMHSIKGMQKEVFEDYIKEELLQVKQDKPKQEQDQQVEETSQSEVNSCLIPLSTISIQKIIDVPQLAEVEVLPITKKNDQQEQKQQLQQLPQQLPLQIQLPPQTPQPTQQPQQPQQTHSPYQTQESISSLYQEYMVVKKSERFINVPGIKKQLVEFPISVAQITELIFMGKPYITEEHTYNGGFFEYLMISFSKDKNIVMPQYQPTPAWDSMSKRTISFIHPVREKVLFAPESVVCTANDTLYLFSREQVYIERDMGFTKIPYGDHFRFNGYYHINSTGISRCTVEFGFMINFLKNTVWRSKIESSNLAETLESWNLGTKPYITKAIQKHHSRLSSQMEVNKEKVEIVAEEEQKLVPNDVLVEETDLLKDQLGQIQSLSQQTVVEQTSAIEVLQIKQNLQDKIDRLQISIYILIGLVIVNLVLTLLK